MADTDHQGMQFPHVATILADTTDPAKDGPILIEGNPTDAPCRKGFSNLLHSRVQVWPRFWPVHSKALHQQHRNLADRLFIVSVKINHVHIRIPSFVPCLT